MRAFAAIENCRGKAGLIQRLVAQLTDQGVTVSTLKRVSDDADPERSGRDTDLQRQAGAREAVIANGFRRALPNGERECFDEPDVGVPVARLSPVDVVLVGADGGREP